MKAGPLRPLFTLGGLLFGSAMPTKLKCGCGAMVPDVPGNLGWEGVILLPCPCTSAPLPIYSHKFRRNSGLDYPPPLATSPPPVPPPREDGEPGTLAFWGFLLFQWCLPLCASEPEPPPQGGGEPGRTLAGRWQGRGG